jgi:hypothetical protein
MEKFKVGDTVQVLIPGNTYTSYDAKFRELGFTNTVENQSFAQNAIAKVFVVSEHGDSGLPLLGLHAPDGSQCLISAKAVVKVIIQPSSDKVEMFDILREFCDTALSSHNVSDRDIYVYLLQKSCK